MTVRILGARVVFVASRDGAGRVGPDDRRGPALNLSGHVGWNRLASSPPPRRRHADACALITPGQHATIDGVERALAGVAAGRFVFDPPAEIAGGKQCT